MIFKLGRYIAWCLMLTSAFKSTLVFLGISLICFLLTFEICIKTMFSCTPDQEIRDYYPCEVILSHMPVPACGKDKKNSHVSAASWSHFDLWCHCNVKMMSLCHISANWEFSGSPFHFSNMKYGTKWCARKRKTLFLWGWERNILLGQSPFVISWQALWCHFFYPILTFMMDSYNIDQLM